MKPSGTSISAEDAEFYLELLVDVADDLLDRYAFLTLWRIREWDYAGFSDDYFRWPYAGPIQEISFVEELVWVSKEDGFYRFEDIYASHLLQACRETVQMFSHAEDNLIKAMVCRNLERAITVSEEVRLVERTLLAHTMNIARSFDMEGIEETWSAYGLHYETFNEEE